MTKSLLCRPSAAAKSYRPILSDLSLADRPRADSVFAGSLDFKAAVDAVSGADCGAVVSFEGRVREVEEGRPILSLTYEAYPEMAEKEIEKIVRGAQTRWGVRARVLHRVGKVAVGELGFFVVCAGAHRPEVFDACRHIVDAVKASAPIWKVGFEWAHPE